MRNEVMADFPEIVEIRQMIEARVREACPFLADDTVKAMIGPLKENLLMKYVPEMKTNVGEYITKAAVDNFNSLIANPEFIAISKEIPTSISHPFNLCGVPNASKNEYLRLIDDDTLRACFIGAEKLGVYTEINIGSVRECGLELAENELMRVFSIAKAVGCKFTFGTDSHSIKDLEMIRIANDVCDYLGLTRKDIAPHLAEDGVAE